MIDNFDLLPRLDLISSLNNMPNLSGLDVDNNLLHQVNFNYYMIPSFHFSNDVTQLLSENSSFSVLHANVRSLAANHDKLINLISDLTHNFHLLGISETKIMIERDPVVNIDIPGYNFISQPSYHNAGGVGFYIRNDCDFHTRDNLSTSTTDFECLWIEIHSKHQRNIVCSVIYRHPNSNLESFTNFLSKAIDKISKENKYCILMGDFNINLLNYESHIPTDEFINSLGVFCFQPHIIQPTRITEHSATLIDNIYFNSIEHCCVSGNLLYDISDHLPNFLIVNKFSCSTFTPTIYHRDYSNFNEENLLHDVQLIDWEDVLPVTDDVNLIFDSFHAKISEIIEIHVPLRKLSKRQVRLLAKPWITKGIRLSIRKKNNLYKQYLRSKNAYYWTNFKIYRNKIKHLLLISKKSYYNDYFTNNKSNIKETWKGIKQLITLKPTKNSFPTMLKVGNLQLSNSQLIANAFNNYFSTVGSNLANSIPIIQQGWI